MKIGAFFATLALSAAIISNTSSEIVDYYMKEDSVTVYSNLADDSIAFALSGVECRYDLNVIDDNEDKKYTLYLIDVSGSVHSELQEIAKEFVNKMIAGQHKSYYSAIGTFSNELSILGDYTNDRFELASELDEIDFKSDTTNLYSSIKTAIENVNAEAAEKYKRVIVISDGLDSRKDLIAYNALTELLDTTRTQVFTIGIETERNEKALNDFFSVAERSNALSYSINADTDINGICEKLNEYIASLYAYDILVPDSLKDGSIHRLAMIKSGEIIDGIDLRTPMLIIKNDVVSEEVPVNEDKSSEGITIIVLSVAAAFLILTAIVIAVLVRRKDRPVNSEKFENNSTENANNAENIKPVGDVGKQRLESSDETVYLKKQSSTSDETVLLKSTADSEQTVYLNRNKAPATKSTVKITLQDTSRNDMIFSTVLDDEGTYISRERIEGCQQIVVDYERSVSKNHCRIWVDHGELYISDNGSLNGTFVENKRIEGKTMLKDGETIKIGRLKLNLKIKQ